MDDQDIEELMEDDMDDLDIEELMEDDMDDLEIDEGREDVFNDVIHFKRVFIRTAKNVAAYNFKLHKSAEYLDLDTNNCSQKDIESAPVKFIVTKEDILKQAQPDRQILYKYHLDLPTDLETCCCRKKTREAGFKSFHVREIIVPDRVFNHDLDKRIVLAINNAGSKFETLKRYMRVFPLLNFEETFESVLYLYNSILVMLYKENCMDAELVRNCANLFRFTYWVYHHMSSEMPCVLEYVLIQAQKGRFTKELLLDPDAEMDAASECFFTHKIQNMFILIKYGTVPTIPWFFWFDEHTDEDSFDRAVEEGILSFPRVFRIFQVFYVYVKHKDFLQALRYIWRSIKDPFLSQSEILSTLTPENSEEKARDFIEYYVNSVIGESDCGWKPSPRSLKDLCRVEIRKLLSDNDQLPPGISRLNIPKILKSYLKLER